jgi:hypothetical protein
MDVMQGESILWKGNPSWKGLLLYYIKWTVISLLPAALWVLLDQTMDGPPSATIFIALTVLGLVLTYAIGWIKRTTTRYTISDQRIHIRTGIVSRRHGEGPSSRTPLLPHRSFLGSDPSHEPQSTVGRPLPLSGRALRTAASGAAGAPRES